MRFLKSTLIKRILGIVFIMGCSGVFFNGYVGIGEQVHAATGTIDNNTDTKKTDSISTTGIREILNMVLKLIYLLLWPLLVVAGLALDNTLVYASLFHLDAPLWKFWNMMKNFANFALGFMVLFAIIKSILTNSGAGSAKDEKTPLGIIKTTLIAGILIQASWFLMAAAVDVSTIATYAVGGLPLSVLKNTPIGNQKILSVNSFIDLNKFDVLDKKGKDFRVWYSTVYSGKTISMSSCRVEKGFVIGRTLGDSEYRNVEKFKDDPIYKEHEVCVLFGNKLAMRKEDEVMKEVQAKSGNTGEYKSSVGGYDSMMYSLLGLTGGRENNATLTGLLINLASTGQDGLKKGSDLFAASTSITISELINKSKGFVGPLATIYSSLLNFAQLTDANVTTLGETSGVFIIKSLVAIALFFPLIALALVLIARIGVLWLYIVASPFIILKATFKNFIKLGKLDEYLEIKNVIGIIFAPVITVAALSISLIFMTALVNGFSSSGSSEQIHESLGTQTVTPVETGNDAIVFGNIAQLEFTKLPRGEAMDRFSRLMVNFFAIGLMRMIFFAALKANALGKAVGAPIQSFGENVFKTMPVLPIGAGGERIGVGSAASVLKGAPDRWISERESAQKQMASEFVFGKDTSTGTGTTFNAAPIVAGLSKVTDAKGAKEVFEKAGYTDVAGTIANNSPAILAELNKMGDKEKANALKGIELADNGAYTNIVKLDTTNKFEAIVKTAKNSDELVNKFNTATGNDKTTIEAYFTTIGKTEYEAKIGEQTYVITQDLNAKKPYTIKEKTTK